MIDVLRTFDEIEQENLFRGRMTALEHLFSRRLKRLLSAEERAALSRVAEREGFESIEDAVLEQPAETLATLLVAR